MSLISMAIYSTEENKKDECLRRTLTSLESTVDFDRHRLMVSINEATGETMKILSFFKSIVSKIFVNPENIGTAKALNKIWAERRPGENVVKIDDDIVIHQAGWVDDMDECIKIDGYIGQIGLKRKDCWETPWHTSPDYKSELIMLGHNPGEKWRIVERSKHIIGSCVMHSATLLNKVGYLYQPGLYGYDDVIMSHRSYLAGFYSCFLPHIEIDHIDNGQTPYQGWKERHSGEYTQQVITEVHAMMKGEKSIYYEA
jgi:GT2 family glycosyltransferase